MGLDLNLFDDRIISKFEVYRKRTTPLVVAVNQAPSTGATTFPMSLGSLTYDGLEVELTGVIVRTKDINYRLKLTATSNIGWYEGFENKLEGMDKAAQNSNSLQRYRDGYGPSTLWAVRSAGIDPATGNEVFITKDGNLTFLYDPNDVVAVGEERPKAMGTVTSILRYKQFALIVGLRYAVQQQRFNSALYNKVENISMNEVAYNQDRRALYDRWEKPGDVVQFKNINLVGQTYVPVMSSRFIQTESFLAGETITLSYECPKNNWMKRMGMGRLALSSTVTGTSGVFRLSNIRQERGTSYPEATTVSLSVSATF